jgi:molybdenum cofactor synthesis domain-containing protein
MIAAVLTVSDSASAGTRDDLSGPAVKQLLQQNQFIVETGDIVPDEQAAIEAAIRRLAASAALVVTTGGTGIAARDVTPEATRAVCTRLVEGIAERMRSEGTKKTPLAALSRGVCGICGTTLVINLPGSPRAAVESLQAIMELLPHALELLQGNTRHAD